MLDPLIANRVEAHANIGTPEDDAGQDGLCRYLDWDSQFFGFGIAAVNGARFTPESVADIVTWCEARKIRCLYFLIDNTDLEKVSLAEQNGFHLVDIRMTLVNEHIGVAAIKQDEI